MATNTLTKMCLPALVLLVVLIGTPAAAQSSASSPGCLTSSRCIAFASLDLSHSHDGKYDLYLIHSDGSGLVKLTHSTTANDFSPSWSPDGKKLVYRHEASHDGDNDLYVMNADGSGARRLYEGISPAWSPDGTRIAFAGQSGGPGTDIFVINPDGSGLLRLTHTPNQIDEYPAWSPDSRKIIYASTQGVPYASESRALWVMNADGTRKKQLTRGAGDMYPAWAPNGKLIAFQSNRGMKDYRQKTVFTMTPAGKRIKRLVKCLCDHPAWSPNGKHIAVEHWSGGIGILSLAERKTVRVIARNTGGEPGFPAWQPPSR